MYGLCKTYAWASEFPDLLSSSLSRRGAGGGSQLFLAFVKILLFAFASTSGRLAEVVPQACISTSFFFFSLLAHLAHFKVS